METEPVIRKSSRLIEKAAAAALKKASEPPASVATLARTPKRQQAKSTKETSAKSDIKKTTITRVSKATKNTKTTKTTTPTKATKAANATKTTKTAKAIKTTTPTKTTKTVKAATATKATKVTKATKTTKAATESTKPKTVTKRKKSEATPAIETKRPRRSKEIDSEGLAGDTAVEGKRQPTRKRKVDDDISAEQEIKPKKTRARAKEMISLDVILEPRPVNRSDPCSLFPTEIWQQILGFLPLSQVAKISSVSKAWLDGSRSFPAWKAICDACKALGQPKLKYRTHMALACSRSCWICDKCHSYSNGRLKASDIPLPVADEDDDDFVWSLCHSCRSDYYHRHPEPWHEKMNRNWRGDKITKTDACDMFHLSANDLDGLYYDECRNPYYRGAYPMKLFDRQEVQELALRVHAGWVGVSAANNGLYRQRSAECKARDDKFVLRRFTRKNKKGAQPADTSDAAIATQSTEFHDQTQTQTQPYSED
ncbi:hypothetical protein BGZ80_009421 [Entomortierella chlamydospora]|uniref:F-box domain-containing protein n=1 Tax=Entomortierella chlamydospora TaxID=101097 RepID=A0A9P6T0R2_9FUNG|nr:hypothetical protein BGZ79_006228 [Entomortierella chlamydospora]KAG0016115.1 hypothetical protein BGZ80_009421 [Entomortierella chlamydospora]